MKVYQVAVLIALVAGLLMFLSHERGGVLGVDISPAQTSTNSSFTLAGTATTVLSGNPSVALRCFSGGSADVSLGFGTTTGLATGAGLVLQANDTMCFSEGEGNLYKGEIFATGSVAIGLFEI